MKKVGIWIDRKNARIYTLSEEEEKFDIISSNLHFLKHTGFSQSHMKSGGRQDVVSAKTTDEKEKNQLNRYFDGILKTIGRADSIAVFGPGLTPLLFTQRMEMKNKSLWSKLKAVEKSDKMTDNKFKAHVRNFYKWNLAS